MIVLLAACALFLAIHLLPSTPLRAGAVNAMGERGWTIAFSVLSLLTLAFMVSAYNGTPPATPFYDVPMALRYLVALLVLDALLLVVIGLITPGDPTLPAPARGPIGDAKGRGIRRVTRHPFLFGAGLWAAAHMLANPTAPDWVFFGSLMLLSWGGAVAQDRRNRRRHGEPFERYLANTSLVPFAAIMRGHNRFVMAEIGWWRLVLALVVFFGVLHGHAGLFGVAPLN